MAADGFVSVADVEIVAAQAVSGGYRLEAEGRDGADYRIDLHVDLPMDRRTQNVVAELLSQSEWQISRRARQPLGLKRSRSKPTPRP